MNDVVFIENEGVKLIPVKDYRFQVQESPDATLVKRSISQSPIFFAAVEITDICNLDCSYCFIDINKKHSYNGQFERLKTFVRTLYEEHGLMRMSITGGEPFASKHLFEMLEFAEEMEIEVRIHSNGLLIKEHLISRLTAFKCLKEIEISMDHPYDDSFLYSKQKNTVPQRLEICHKLIGAGINAIVSTVLTDEMTDNLLPMRDELLKAGIRTWRLREQLIDLREVRSFEVRPDLIAKLKELAQAPGGIMIYGHLYDILTSGNHEHKCRYTEKNFLFAKYNGDIQWMCGVNLFAGNYYSDPPAKIAKELSALHGNYPIPKRCRQCSSKFVCATSPFKQINPS